MNNKKTILIFLSVILLVIVGVAFYSYQNVMPTVPMAIEAPKPALAIEPADFDLGTVIYGEVGKYTLQVKNVSDKPVKVLRLSTSCGCTKATMAEEDKNIAPGQTVGIVVSFDPAVHQDDTDVGALQRVVYIDTDDANNPEIEAKFKAFVIKK